MLTAPIYRPTEGEIDALVAANPFALVVSYADGELNATPLPLLLEHDDMGAVLIGHFGRGNPQVEDLRRAPRALIVFQGAHGYVSPSWLRDRTQAPTWNFSTVHYLADIVFDPGLDAAVAAVDQLSAAMEGADPNAWSPGEMGARHAALARGVIAFRARVVQTNAKFKLGQNERDDVLDDILDGLQRSAQAELRRDMVTANRKRRTND